MSSRGQLETSHLKNNLETQLDRLVAQLSDLEECRNELDQDEYDETRRDTVEQLEEFQQHLAKLSSGDLTLIDDLSAMQLAIQAAICNAFKTPEIIRLFAKKQPSQLRGKLTQVERDHKIGVLNSEMYTQQKLEILSALQKLNDPLLDEEKTFLQNNLTDSLKEFNKATIQSFSIPQENVSKIL